MTMTLEQLITLETDLGLKFPTHYRNFQLNYPAKLLTLNAPYNTVADLSILAQPEDILTLNRWFGDALVDHIAIGEDGCGNYYFISRDESDEAIYFLDHEAPPIDPATGDAVSGFFCRHEYDNMQKFIDSR